MHVRKIWLFGGGKVLFLVAALTGCSPAGDADIPPERSQDELKAYNVAFRATGVQFWIDHPEQILNRPNEALKALVAAKKIKIDPEKLLSSSRQGPYIVMENDRRIGQLTEIARQARQQRVAEARAALDKYRKDLEDAWPNCWRKECNYDEAK